jgi:geranylgeranyl diphosphate synthase type I
MRHVVASADGPKLLYGMIRYHLGWVDADFAPAEVDGGKRIRPVLLLMANEAQGGAWQQAIPAAAAIELLHNFTLIHDDIEDRDEVRRGRPTLWTLWDVPQAINAGDALFTLAYRALLRLHTRGVTPGDEMEAVNLFTEATLRITEGQCLDIAFESEAIVDEATYLEMIGGKTAALLGLACEMGAHLAGAPPAQRSALCDFGEALGKAFQMQDDLLGLWGDPARTGKPVGSDLRKRKKTLPILHGMAARPELRELLLDAEVGEDDVPQALEMLEAAGSRAYTEAKAHAFHEQALAAWEASHGSGEAHAALHDLAQRLLRRDK